MYELGDRHNFGRQTVSYSPCLIHKPRSCHLEWMIFNKSSYLPNAIKEIIPFDINFFELVPILNFELMNDDILGSGLVSKVPNVELATDFNELEIKRLGSAIAFLQMLGVSDLHKENVIFGRDASGSLVFAPIDIENAFQNLILPSQTGLIPKNCLLNESHSSGLHSFLGHKNLDVHNVGMLIDGYFSSLNFYASHLDLIVDAVSKSLNFETQPLRVILRNTNFYKGILTSEVGYFDNLLPEEKQQLSRGDVPYFYRYLHSDDLYYISKNKKCVRIDNKENAFKLIKNYKDDFFSLSVSQQFSMKRIQLMKRNGVAQIAGMLKAQSFEKTYVGNICLEKTREHIQITADGLNLNIKIGAHCE